MLVNSAIPYKTSYPAASAGQPAFGGFIKGLFAGAITGVVYYLGLCAQDNPPVGNYTPIISQKIGWSDNTQVLASQSQRYKANGINETAMDNNNTKISGFYSLKLLQNLKNGAESINEAHLMAETKGLKIGNKILNETIGYSQFPVATPHVVDCWNKKDRKKNRIILAIGGNGAEFTRSVNGFCKEIAEIYRVSNKNIIKIPEANAESFKKGMSDLSKKIQKLNSDNTELLIYYNGHGVADFSGIPFAQYLFDEGNLTGITEAGFDEKDLKKIVNKKLKEIKTLIIMDTCHSGAWIAQNNTKKGDCSKPLPAQAWLAQNNAKVKHNPNAVFYPARSGRRYV